MTLKKKIIGGLILLALVGGGYYFFTRPSTEVIQTEKVSRGDVVETVSISGELVPSDYADLSFPGVGVIDRVAVKEGDVVSEGDILFSLDRAVLWSQLKEARIARSIVEENEKLARRNWDDLKPEERLAKKLATEQARESVRTIEAQMNEDVLTAPFSGKISRVDAKLGEVVTIGKVVARLVRDGNFIIEARVPESDIAKVKLGMQASVTFDAFSLEDEFSAEVYEIDPSATVVQDVVSYVVKFHLSEIDPRLKEGMTANIDIETAKRADVLTVQFRALSKEGGKNYAEVKRGDGQFERVEVTTGVEGDEGVIEIISGLKEGDEVTIGAKQKK